jgi:hypothetical protein
MGDDPSREKEQEEVMADGRFAERFKKLRLTEKEKKVLVMDDLEDDEGSKIAVVGKLLPPSKFHIETIRSALRPQWGNPRGLEFQAMGDNVFLATFEKEQDRRRVWEGAPWMVGNHAIVLDNFETSKRPSEFSFGRTPIWIQCHDLLKYWAHF